MQISPEAMQRLYKVLNSDTPEDPLALGVKGMVENYGYDPNLINNTTDAINVIQDTNPNLNFESDYVGSPTYYSPDPNTGPFAYESAQMFETGGVPRIGNSDYTINDLRLQGMSEDDILNLLRNLSAKGYEI